MMKTKRQREIPKLIVPLSSVSRTVRVESGFGALFDCRCFQLQTLNLLKPLAA